MPDAVDFLGTLAVESELAKQLDFNEIIETFANKKSAQGCCRHFPSLDNLCVLYVYVYVLFLNLFCT